MWRPGIVFLWKDQRYMVLEGPYWDCMASCKQHCVPPSPFPTQRAYSSPMSLHKVDLMLSYFWPVIRHCSSCHRAVCQEHLTRSGNYQWSLQLFSKISVCNFPCPILQFTLQVVRAKHSHLFINSWAAAWNHFLACGDDSPQPSVISQCLWSVRMYQRSKIQSLQVGDCPELLHPIGPAEGSYPSVSIGYKVFCKHRDRKTKVSVPGVNQMDLGEWTEQDGNQEMSSSEGENKEGEEKYGDIWGRSTKNCLWNRDVSLGPMYHQVGGTKYK